LPFCRPPPPFSHNRRTAPYNGRQHAGSNYFPRHFATFSLFQKAFERRALVLTTGQYRSPVRPYEFWSLLHIKRCFTVATCIEIRYAANAKLCLYPLSRFVGELCGLTGGLPSHYALISSIPCQVRTAVSTWTWARVKQRQGSLGIGFESLKWLKSS